jgi:hypothetical protein
MKPGALDGTDVSCTPGRGESNRFRVRHDRELQAVPFQLGNQRAVVIATRGRDKTDRADECCPDLRRPQKDKWDTG